MLSFERPVRIFLADEQPIFLAGLQACFAEQPGIQVVGQTHSAARLIAAIEEAAPDIALISDSLSGVPVIETVLAGLPSQRIIALAAEFEHARAQDLLARGVRGYVLKHSPASVVAKALAAVLRGGRFVDASEAWPGAPPARRSSALTGREQEVLRLIALGFSIREAAERMGVTIKSAETYKARAGAKLGIEGRRKIVQYAIAQGWFAERA